MLADYHMHLIHDMHEEKCPYTLDRIGEYLAVAESRGINEIGITEHCHRFVQFSELMLPLTQGDDAFEACQWIARQLSEDLDDYVEALVQAKQRGWPVKVSLEVDYLDGQEDALRELLAPYPWDYLLGAVHYIGKWGFDISPNAGWPARSVHEAYQDYFGLLQKAAASGLFDTLAHPDLIKKFGHRPSPLPLHVYEETADTIAKAGVAIEVSTAGLRRKETELYPGPELIHLLRARNVPITLGSDAHRPRDVGADFDSALAGCAEAGYTSFFTFEGRQRTSHPLPVSGESPNA